ncbi:TonB-dependent receptor [Campylobacter sp. RM16187]|uniref:TonB-dependent receptor n=1 Tax=Campylobacter sp. RM16187 TaxID=1660063 RepID=UPI0021B5F640|nr:TonB-dependent receptor [Campylobacter sp. RM16187]QKG29703.1 heme uptake system outer membrane receptor [Campylobacter sp. RM16187]
MFKKIAIISVVAASTIYGADTVARLDKMVITTTGFESPLKDEVRNVSIITSKEIEDRGYKDLREILEKAPGVSFNGKTVDLRGQGSKANTSVKVLLNGVAMNMIDTTPTTIPIDLVPIEDIEQVEIIPGGGAVLYGSGTSGGVINIITKQKATKPYANISTKIASYSYKDINFGVGGNVTNDLFLKANAKVFDEKGYRHDEKNRGHYTSFGLNYKISDNQSIVFNPSYFKAKTYGVPALSAKEMAENRRQAGGKASLITSKRLNLDADYAIKFSNNIDMHIMPYYQDVKILQSTFHMKDRKTGGNLKARYNYGNGELIAGYDYLNNEGYRMISINQKMPMGFIKQLTVFDMQKQTHSIYLVEKHNFNDFFSISGGLRFERADYNVKRNVTGTRSIAGKTKVTNDYLNVGDNKNNYAYEITPNFKYSDSGSIYFKFERGYISPGPNQLIDKLGPDGPYVLNSLKSETYKGYEIGLKDLIFGNFFSATLFLTDTKDEILTVSLGRGVSDGWNFKNIDKTRRYGAEIYSEQEFGKFKLKETFSYVNAEIKAGKRAGKKVPLVEKSKFVLGAEYEPIKNLNLSADFKYLSSSLDGNYDKIDSREIVDIGLSYKFTKGFLVSAGIKNLFNEKYNYSQSKKGDSYDPAPERNYYVEFKYNY